MPPRNKKPQTITASSRKIVFFQRTLSAWYNEHRRPFSWRDPSATVFYRILAELLLQRTKAETADRVLIRLTQALGSWRAIAEAPDEELQQHLKPLGLWRRRIPALRQFASAMYQRGGVFPHSREELEAIPAVGQYIANAILLFVHAEPQPLLDVNMARLLERFFGPRQLADIRDDPFLQKIARTILQGVDAQAMNWAVLDFATAICRVQKPACDRCPLSRHCAYFKANQGTGS